jgi:hypothetical protein
MLLTNHSLSNCDFCLSSSLPCILSPYTLFFLNIRNMAVEVEKTGAEVDFLDTECFNSIVLSHGPLFAFAASYM